MPESNKVEIKCPLDAVSILLETVQVLNVAGTAFFKVAPIEIRNNPDTVRALENHISALNHALQVAEWYRENLKLMEKQFE